MNLPSKKDYVIPNNVTNARRQDDYIDRLWDCLDQAHALCNKFIKKVQYGWAHSTETYAECCAMVQAIRKIKRDYPQGYRYNKGGTSNASTNDKPDEGDW